MLTCPQIGIFLASDNSPYTLSDFSNNHLIETLVIMHGDRTKVELNDFHCAFTPPDHSTAIADINRIFFDDESYNYGHGQAYQTFGIDVTNGCLVIIRPDQCKFVSAFLLFVLSRGNDQPSSEIDLADTRFPRCFSCDQSRRLHGIDTTISAVPLSEIEVLIKTCWLYVLQFSEIRD